MNEVGADGIWRVEARNASKRPAVYRPAPHSKSYTAKISVVIGYSVKLKLLTFMSQSMHSSENQVLSTVFILRRLSPWEESDICPKMFHCLFFLIAIYKCYKIIHIF